MKKKNFISAIGAIALVLGTGLNLQYSLDDYGLRTNSLSAFVLAQKSSGGELGYGSASGGEGSSSGSSGWFWTLIKTNVECTYASGGVSGGVSGGLPGGVSGGVSGGEDVTITYKGLVWECYDGWNPFCTKDCRAPI